MQSVWALMTGPVLQTRRSVAESVLVASEREISPLRAQCPELAIPPVSTFRVLDWQQDHRDVAIHSEEPEEIRHLPALVSYMPTRSSYLLQGRGESVAFLLQAGLGIATR